MHKDQEEIRFRQKDAFAVYSLPGTKSHTIVYAEDRGWVTHPTQSPAYLIQSFDHKGQEPTSIVADHVIHDAPFHCDVRERTEVVSTSEEDYLSIARETIDAIRRNEFGKVVISKVKRIPRYRGKVYDLFIDLKMRYPGAFVFLYHVPGRGYWCGATPEVLLRRTERSYRTMALAGTQRDKGQDLKDAFWGSKEQHEQRVIETFVEGRLEDAFISFRKRGPYTVRAGQVLHICSEYFIDREASMRILSERLHPGPAICGLPQDDAREWIKMYEHHDRGDYCGYTGPWGIDNEHALYVNLRSMSIWKNAYLLYLGGGLTAQSEAREEWEETELKAQTLLSAIEQTQSV
ncbi:MAG: chorismate-binding protein [Bacteroidota bacterium]